MKKSSLIMAAATAALFSAPLFASTASAHAVGERCYYQRVDEDGFVRSTSQRCHHIPSRFRHGGHSGFSLFFDLGGGGWYYDHAPRRWAHGQNLVCLVTFFRRSDVAGGADVNVQRARLMSRAAANRIDGPNDRHRIFDYGTNQQTRRTCRYLNNINN